MYVFDAAWLALAVVLTAVLGAVALIRWRRAGARPALFWGGLALLPMAAYLTGTLRLGAVVVDQVARYLTGFAFSPAVWAGVLLGGLGAVLVVASRALRRREPSRRRPAVTGSTAGREVAAASAPPAASTSPGSSTDPELDDIEAILRRHGIS